MVPGQDTLSLVNAAIIGQVVHLKAGNDALAKKLHRLAGSVYGIAKEEAGRATKLLPKALNT